MKATLILMTAVFAAGDHGAPAPVAPAPAVVAPSCGTGGCGSTCGADCGYGYYDNCGCCNEGFFSKLRGRLGGLFNRGCCHSNDCGYSSCNTCTTTSSCCNTYSSGCCNTYSSCGTYSGCGSCCEAPRWSFGCRLRGLFNRGSCCNNSYYGYGCDTCGNSACVGGNCVGGNCAGGVISPGAPAIAPGNTPAVVIPPAQKEDGGAAKKMPTGDKAAPENNVSDTAPIGAIPANNNPVAGPIPVANPDLGIAPPATVPNIPTDLNKKSPF